MQDLPRAVDKQIKFDKFYYLPLCFIIIILVCVYSIINININNYVVYYLAYLFVYLCISIAHFLLITKFIHKYTTNLHIIINFIKVFFDSVIIIILIDISGGIVLSSNLLVGSPFLIVYVLIFIKLFYTMGKSAYLFMSIILYFFSEMSYFLIINLSLEELIKNQTFLFIHSLLLIFVIYTIFFLKKQDNISDENIDTEADINDKPEISSISKETHNNDLSEEKKRISKDIELLSNATKDILSNKDTTYSDNLISFLDNSKLPVAVINILNQKIIYSNEAFSRLFGYSSLEIRRFSKFDLILSDRLNIDKIWSEKYKILFGITKNKSKIRLMVMPIYKSNINGNMYISIINLSHFEILYKEIKKKNLEIDYINQLEIQFLSITKEIFYEVFFNLINKKDITPNEVKKIEENFFILFNSDNLSIKEINLFEMISRIVDSMNILSSKYKISINIKESKI